MLRNVLWLFCFEPDNFVLRLPIKTKRKATKSVHGSIVLGADCLFPRWKIHLSFKFVTSLLGLRLINFKQLTKKLIVEF